MEIIEVFTACWLGKQNLLGPHIGYMGQHKRMASLLLHATPQGHLENIIPNEGAITEDHIFYQSVSRKVRKSK